MNATTTEHRGTLAEFLSDRNSRATNEEQMEAFGREFYLMLAQIVNTRANAFSLISEMTFPRVADPDKITMEGFVRWTFRYFDWVEGLFHFEKEVLANVRVTWE